MRWKAAPVHGEQTLQGPQTCHGTRADEPPAQRREARAASLQSRSPAGRQEQASRVARAELAKPQQLGPRALFGAIRASLCGTKRATDSTDPRRMARPADWPVSPKVLPLARGSASGPDESAALPLVVLGGASSTQVEPPCRELVLDSRRHAAAQHCRRCHRGLGSRPLARGGCASYDDRTAQGRRWRPVACARAFCRPTGEDGASCSWPTVWRVRSSACGAGRTS